jgi:hypothetical protein
MSNLYLWLDSRGITYKIEKTDADDSIMILEYVQIEKKLRMKP